MKVLIHPHATERIEERGAKIEEVMATVEYGESFPAKHGRTGLKLPAASYGESSTVGNSVYF